MSTQKVTVELLERENHQLRLENQRLKLRLERAEQEIAELELDNDRLRIECGHISEMDMYDVREEYE